MATKIHPPGYQYPLAALAKVRAVDSETLRREAMRGQIDAVQDAAGLWWVSEKSYNGAVVRRGGQQAASEAAAQVPASFNDIREQVARYHLLRVETEVILRSLSADAREAEHAGDDSRAITCRELLDALPAATYAWDAERQAWRIECMDVVVYSRSVSETPAATGGRS